MSRSNPPSVGVSRLEKEINREIKQRIIRVQVYSKSSRTWDEIEIPSHFTEAMLRQARSTFRFLIKDRSDRLGFTPNDWARRALEEIGCPQQYLSGFNLFALVHLVKLFKIKIDGKILNEPYPVLGEAE